MSMGLATNQWKEPRLHPYRSHHRGLTFLEVLNMVNQRFDSILPPLCTQPTSSAESSPFCYPRWLRLPRATTCKLVIQPLVNPRVRTIATSTSPLFLNLIRCNHPAVPVELEQCRCRVYHFHWTRWLRLRTSQPRPGVHPRSTVVLLVLPRFVHNRQ